MPSVQVHHDGWLALPEAIQRKLGVGIGDWLDVEFADGAVVLHPAWPADAAGDAALEPAPDEQLIEAEPGPTSVAAPTPAVKRGPGRPWKASADVAPTSSPKARGRRKNVVATDTQPA
jgi:hypothetical protein